MIYFVLIPRQLCCEEVHFFELYLVWNIDENYQHVAIISPDVQRDYQLMIDPIMLNLHQIKRGQLLHVKSDSFDSKEFVFTGKVYLYTDRLNLNKRTLIRYFKKNNLVLEVRDDNYSQEKFESLNTVVSPCNQDH